MVGTYRSTQDGSTRRVFLVGKEKKPHAARTRPNCPEEEPYSIEPAFVARLVSFGCWVKLP